MADLVKCYVARGDREIVVPCPPQESKPASAAATPAPAAKSLSEVAEHALAEAYARFVDLCSGEWRNRKACK